MPDETEGFDEPDSSGDGDRLSRVEDKVDALAAAVAKLIPASHADAQQRTGQRLDRPSTVEEQVRAELEKRDRQAAEKKAADDAAAEAKTERETVAERLAKLEETPPAPPERRATRVMWGSSR